MTKLDNIAIEKAIEVALKAHQGQRRLYTSEPYVFHVMEVAGILMQFEWFGTDMLIAAILHDTLEDTDLKENEIEEMFGAGVLGYVKGLTDVSKPEDGNRATRKEMDCAHLLEQNTDVHIIKCADIISNASSLGKWDSDFAKIHAQECLNFLNEVPDSVKKEKIWEAAFLACHRNTP